jgi:hypothetical protein
VTTFSFFWLFVSFVYFFFYSNVRNYIFIPQLSHDAAVRVSFQVVGNGWNDIKETKSQKIVVAGPPFKVHFSY